MLDLRKLFGLTGAQQTTQTRIVVVSVQARLVGLIVDSGGRSSACAQKRD